MKSLNASLKKRYLLKLYGIVQGVGFRPFVYRTAVEHTICGFVQNSGGFVTIDITGTALNIKCFLLKLIKEPPISASIERVQCRTLKYKAYEDFKIVKSCEKHSAYSFISPDIGVCPKCLQDMKNKDGRYYRYAFTGCTDCGPRYSIIKAVPYDRDNTTMSKFKRCKSCSDEYESALNRRFHAEESCCRDCGPSLILMNNKHEIKKYSDIIDETIKLLSHGKIIAIKGIGGFHLVCDGKNEKAVCQLRLRKNRKSKPLAVMMKNTAVVKRYCIVSDREEKLLKSPERPIVLLRKREDIKLPFNIAPNMKKLGVMLPYAPLHYLLLKEALEVIVMTSGNISGCPIEYKNDSALEKLKVAADYFLMHNREICVPIDDSVAEVFKRKLFLIRMGRGYAPHMEKLNTLDDIAALGAQEKSSISLSKNGYVYTSQYLGDLDDLASYENYKYVLKHLTKLLKVNPKAWAVDLHPFYASSKYAEDKEGIKIRVQHHHAHMVSCMVEHGLFEKVLGVIYDGTGYGTDGNLWGGEFLLGTRYDFKRAGHFQYVTLQGGDLAAKEPFRCALSYLYSLGYKVNESNLIVKALNKGLNCHKSSSVGRLFDCISSLIELVHKNTYEGEAAARLENIIDEGVSEGYECSITNEKNVLLIGVKNLLRGVLRDKKAGVSKGVIAAKFHNALCRVTCEVVFKLSELYKVKKVVLSGGVFQNEHLLKGVYEGLTRKGLKVYFNSRIPINDGGISVGQLAIADTVIKKEGIHSVSSTARKDKSCL